MTIVIRATVITVSHTVTIAVLRSEEARPGKTTEQGELRVHAGLGSLDTKEEVFFVFHHAGKVDIVVVANVDRSTELDVEANRQVEYGTTGHLLHVELFRKTIQSDVPCKVFGLDIHVEFTEEREEVQHVEFESSTCKRERHVSLVHRHAVTTVDMDEERHNVNLGKVERQSSTDCHHRLSSTVRESHANFLGNVFRFTNPDTLLGVLGSLERISEESSEVDRHICRNRSASLQASSHVTDVANLRTSECSAIAALFFATNGIAVELVIEDRQRHTDVEVVQKTNSEAYIGADTAIVSDFSLLVRVIILENIVVTVFRISLEHAIAKCIIAQSCKHKLRMTKRLS